MEANLLIDLYSGLRNLLACKQRLAQLLKLDSSFFAIRFNIDKFICFNDTFGHNKGDEVILEIGSILLKYNNRFDTFRVGGNDFICFYDNQKKSVIKNTIRNINQEIKIKFMEFEMNYNHPPKPFTLTITGVYLQICHNGCKDVEFWLSELDKKFYKFKSVRYKILKN